MHSQSDKQSSFRYETDTELIDRFFDLCDYDKVDEQAIRNEIARRGGLQREIFLRRDTVRKQQFPGFVAGVLTFSLFPLLFGVISAKSFDIPTMMFTHSLVFAIVFLSTFNATMRPKYWRRSLSLIGVFVLVQVLSEGVSEINKANLLGGPALLLVYPLIFWEIGWLGTKVFSRTMSNESYFVKLLSKIWPDLSVTERKNLRQSI